MSSPAVGFSSWRRSPRRSSSVSQYASAQEEIESSSSSTTIPARSCQDTPSNDVHQLYATSVNSVAHREPLRSFIHGSVRDNLAPLDSYQYAQSVRQDTAELANYFLSDSKDGQSPAFLNRRRSSVSQQTILGHTAQGADTEGAEEGNGRHQDTINEVSEPPSPEETDVKSSVEGPSMLTTMLRRSPPNTIHMPASNNDEPQEEDESWENGESSRRGSWKHPAPAQPSTERHAEAADTSDEHAPLLRTTSREARHSYGMANGSSHEADIEDQKTPKRRWTTKIADSARDRRDRFTSIAKVAANPKRWDRHALWENVIVAPVTCLPAVIVGLLLNILDALSYGMILFPLGSPIFSSLGSAGISIFYVSTIISQLTFSFGSVFKGGVGSELIEVVPFFHSMAGTITEIVGEDDPEAVIATTITSYALSSMLTGTVFYLMGKFKFGYLVGFIPRHILIGCIGGVGWFLIATGFEVTARLDGSLNYDLDTLKRLIQSDTVPLWTIPLGLAIVLFYGQTKITSKYFLPLYILTIPALFYMVSFILGGPDPDFLQKHGWVFEGPPPGEPWWYFYTLYKFHKVDWSAIVQCIPAMFALTFFGILHVPINVPALAQNIGEDHADLDHELKLHGYSNFLSGCFGSIQNYLVYANSVFFMRSGGNTRLGGMMLAALTFLVMMIGPSLIGFIPVMMVGVLIFDLGFELLIEAVWQPRKKLKWLEYMTVLVIVVVMGTYDFVIGIGVGILCAFAALIIQTSRVSAVRASYSGEVVGSTVRRNPTQQHYLRDVGKQVNIIKLAGYLFFGTIVSVEEKIRAMISDEEFNNHPIRFLIIDLWLVNGVDYSAGEVFNTITRLLNHKGVELIISGVDTEQELGRHLRAAGLGEDGIDVKLLPELNSALEYCENELLKTLYASQEAARLSRTSLSSPSSSLQVPSAQTSSLQPSLEPLGSSPRRSHLQVAARHALNQQAEQQRVSTRWQSFKEPLRLMLQIFQDVSDKNEDFWFRAVGYFKRLQYPAGTVIFRRGEKAEGFYLLEQGMLRAEYDLPQGWLCESIVAGTTCGELPFFSETTRTATCVVERDCVLWMMDQEGWEKLQKEQPDVARELLRMGLKLTSERMSVITSYTLTMAG
ncbi:sulfate transporter family-domain-containing protein [Copromyces sp. CBS 386.78]|nr:sulfate transporter family-domain-containing protein [Copromyces sp. CBS 386.78]